jgi:hypothetical protein
MTILPLAVSKSLPWSSSSSVPCSSPSSLCSSPRTLAAASGPPLPCSSLPPPARSGRALSPAHELRCGGAPSCEGRATRPATTSAGWSGSVRKEEEKGGGWWGPQGVRWPFHPVGLTPLAQNMDKMGKQKLSAWHTCACGIFYSIYVTAVFFYGICVNHSMFGGPAQPSPVLFL